MSTNVSEAVDDLVDAKIKATTNESEIAQLLGIKGKVAIANADFTYLYQLFECYLSYSPRSRGATVCISPLHKTAEEPARIVQR